MLIGRHMTLLKESRGVAIGVPGVGGAGQSPPKFCRSANPIQTKGADYAPHTTVVRIQKSIYTSGKESFLAKFVDSKSQNKIIEPKLLPKTN